MSMRKIVSALFHKIFLIFHIRSVNRLKCFVNWIQRVFVQLWLPIHVEWATFYYNNKKFNKKKKKHFSNRVRNWNREKGLYLMGSFGFGSPQFSLAHLWIQRVKHSARCSYSVVGHLEYDKKRRENSSLNWSNFQSQQQKCDSRCEWLENGCVIWFRSC